jgi:hypothetical protein
MSFFSKFNIFKRLREAEETIISLKKQVNFISYDNIRRFEVIEHDLGFDVRNEHGMKYTVHACLVDHATEIAADTQFLQDKFGEDCLDTVVTWNSEKKKQREKLQGEGVK